MPISKKQKIINKIKIRNNESVINIQSRNYMPIVATCLLASILAQHIAMINAIKQESFK